MAECRIREIAPGKLPEAIDVYLTTRVDMHRRMGHQPAPITPEERALTERNYRHILQTGILRVAEVDGRIIGAVCHAVVRDRGAAPEAIRCALGAGLKLTMFSHFLTTGPFGMPDRYLPSGPLLD
ncbi:MAG TPA: hypothetical protein VD969_18635 [Symbiobacteriaceae bacterium]|nr:hypothetical protein [Symbiobacteriaceae bacterium]